MYFLEHAVCNTFVKKSDSILKFTMKFSDPSLGHFHIVNLRDG
jgi:hypothetical protein